MPCILDVENKPVRDRIEKIRRLVAAFAILQSCSYGGEEADIPSDDRSLQTIKLPVSLALNVGLTSEVVQVAVGISVWAFCIIAFAS